MILKTMKARLMAVKLTCIDEDEARLTNPSTPQQVKCTATKPVTLPVIEGTIKSVICELLNSLIIVDVNPSNESK